MILLWHEKGWFELIEKQTDKELKSIYNDGKIILDICHYIK